MWYVKTMCSALAVCTVLCGSHVWGQHRNSPGTGGRPYAEQAPSEPENWRTEIKYFAEILGPGGTVDLKLGSYDTYKQAENVCVNWSTSHPNDLRSWKVREVRTQVRYFPPLQEKPQPPSAPLSGPFRPNVTIGVQNGNRPFVAQNPPRPATEAELRRIAAQIARENPELVASIRRSMNSQPQPSSAPIGQSTARPDARSTSQGQTQNSTSLNFAGTKWSFPPERHYLRIYANGRYEFGFSKGVVSNDRGSWTQKDGKLILNTDRGYVEEYTYDGKSLYRNDRAFPRLE